MQGRDYFAERDWANVYDRNLVTWQTGEMRNGRDFATQPITRNEYDAVYEGLRMRYVEWRLTRDRIDGRETDHLWEGVKELDVSALEEKSFDRPKLGKFKLEYDTLDEVRMRFRQTCILIKGNPFYVSDMRQRDNGFVFLVENSADEKSFVPLAAIPDLRGAPPGYIIFEGGAAYMMRTPARVNQQGMNQQNTQFRKISTNQNIGCSPKQIVQAIESKGKTLPWNERYLDLFEQRAVGELRLSDEISVFTKPKVKKIYVGYKGRVFGGLEKNGVKAVDEDDLIQPWVKKDFAKVNLEVRQ